MIMWVGGALAAGGSIVASSMGMSSTKEQVKSQERAMKDKHQWEVKDLKKAGLNPILSAHNSGGGMPGASFTPENPFQDWSANSAKDQEKKLTTSRINTEAEQQKTLRTQQALNQANANASQAQALKSAAETANINLKSGTEEKKSVFSQDLLNAYEWTRDGVKNHFFNHSAKELWDNAIDRIYQNRTLDDGTKIRGDRKKQKTRFNSKKKNHDKVKLKYLLPKSDTKGWKK